MIKIHDGPQDAANQKPMRFTSGCAIFSQKINWNEATALTWRSTTGKRPLVVKVRRGFPAGVSLLPIWLSRRRTSPFEAAKRCKDLKPKMESKVQNVAAINCMVEISDQSLMMKKLWVSVVLMFSGSQKPFTRDMHPQLHDIYVHDKSKSPVSLQGKYAWIRPGSIVVPH